MDIKKRQMVNSEHKGGKKRSNEYLVKPNSKEEKPECENVGIFADIFIFILPTGIGKGRIKILKAGIVSNGGVALDDSCDERLTHVAADDSLTFERILKLLPDKKTKRLPIYLKAGWLCECLKQKSRLDDKEYLFANSTKNLQENVAKAAADKLNLLNENVELKSLEIVRARTPTSPIALDDHGASNSNQSTFNKVTDWNFALNKTGFACSQSSGQHKINHNEHITDKLENLAVTFKSTQDHWRAMGYQRAISALKNHNKEVASWEEARALPGIGERLADKIWEIIESGRLRKMEEICQEGTTEALNLFMNIWGVGPNTAQLFVHQGFRTLEDIEAKADLNRQQRIGLKHYWDILDRMPRPEASEIERTVKEAALSLQSGLEIMACGSYRRGNTTCGDVDILITHPDGKSHWDLLPRLLTALHLSGFLTDDLVTHEKSGNQHKYMGVCKLPGANTKHRRLDIIIVPHPEFACSLLYFTGSAHFNRSMRLLARKMGMTLSEHSLSAGVIRKGQEKICSGTPLSTPTEESVFEHLGIPFRPPEERNH